MQVSETMNRINNAWLRGDVGALRPLVHPDVVMMLPGFSGSIQGRQALLGGFEDFCVNAKVLAFDETDRTVDEIGETAVVSLRFDMLYERGAQRSRSTGRDLWVFQRDGEDWIAVWRTMLDVTDDPA